MLLLRILTCWQKWQYLLAPPRQRVRCSVREAFFTKQLPLLNERTRARTRAISAYLWCDGVASSWPASSAERFALAAAPAIVSPAMLEDLGLILVTYDRESARDLD